MWNALKQYLRKMRKLDQAMFWSDVPQVPPQHNGFILPSVNLPGDHKTVKFYDETL
jgi:hypothetical protein